MPPKAENDSWKPASKKAAGSHASTTTAERRKCDPSGSARPSLPPAEESDGEHEAAEDRRLERAHARVDDDHRDEEAEPAREEAEAGEEEAQVRARNRDHVQ